MAITNSKEEIRVGKEKGKILKLPLQYMVGNMRLAYFSQSWSVLHCFIILLMGYGRMVDKCSWSSEARENALSSVGSIEAM